MSAEISPIQPPKSMSQAVGSKSTIERIYSDGSGKHIVDRTIYIVTVYDSNGRVSTVTNSHKINYLV